MGLELRQSDYKIVHDNQVKLSFFLILCLWGGVRYMSAYEGQWIAVSVCGVHAAFVARKGMHDMSHLFV
jgi:hypothetical protein